MQPLLQKHNLNSFDALWSLQLQAVDEPNHKGDGHSTVAYLALDGQGFYIKRQANYFTRSFHKPFGESTCAREFRAISTFSKLKIPALQAAYFAERREAKQHQAILITYALSDWQELDYYLAQWPQLKPEQQQGLIQASAKLVKTLHAAGQMHGCLYPKHIFIKESANTYAAQFIDLEKVRPLLLCTRDRVKDLETLIRRAKHAWGDAEQAMFLQYYLDNPQRIDSWQKRLSKKHQRKVSR